MANIALNGTPTQTSGNLIEIGQQAPDFKLTATDLSTKTLEDFKGHKLILNIFPSIDTGTCAASVRNFNKEAASLKNTKVLCISRDLPFAQSRFCGAEGIENVINLSDFGTGDFGKNYGLEITNGPFVHLHSRVIVVIDKNGKVIYTEQVPDISNEPNYKNALKAIE
uniref:thiol peroxidase n=1 Tax=Polaribacter sp. TaxID=1920175 RepID=UPI0040475ED4